MKVHRLTLVFIAGRLTALHRGTSALSTTGVNRISSVARFIKRVFHDGTAGIMYGLHSKSRPLFINNSFNCVASAIHATFTQGFHFSLLFAECRFLIILDVFVRALQVLPASLQRSHCSGSRSLSRDNFAKNKCREPRSDLVHGIRATFSALIRHCLQQFKTVRDGSTVCPPFHPSPHLRDFPPASLP